MLDKVVNDVDLLENLIVTYITHVETSEGIENNANLSQSLRDDVGETNDKISTLFEGLLEKRGVNVQTLWDTYWKNKEGEVYGTSNNT